MPAVPDHDTFSNVIIGNKARDVSDCYIIFNGAVVDMGISYTVRQRQSAPLTRYAFKESQFHCTGESDILDPLSIERLLDQYTPPVSYTHLRAHETGRNLVCRLLLE